MTPGAWEAVESRLKQVELIALDVDGVLTDGNLFYLPDGQIMPSGFHVHDGMGIRVAMEAGLKVIFVSGNWTQSVITRAEHLKVSGHWLGVGKKPDSLVEASEKFDIALEHFAFVGDDLNDLACFAMVGLPIAVGDATPEVKKAAAVVCERPGGRGAVRETVEAILRAQGKWEEGVARFLAEVDRRGFKPELKPG